MSNDQSASHMPDLQMAIEELYLVFEPYVLPQFTNPCPCCHKEPDEALLRSQPLRKLEPRELSKYVFDALLTWGDSALFRHFLPRIYELMVRPYGPNSLPIDPEIVLSKLRHGRWREWPVQEQHAMERFLRALWHERLGDIVGEGYDYDGESETWLCAIAQAEDVLAPYLSQWLMDTRQTAAEALVAFILRTTIAGSDGMARDAFWNGRDAQYTELRRWVVSPEVKMMLQYAADHAVGASRTEVEAALARISA
jgi:hypothetical protein